MLSVVKNGFGKRGGRPLVIPRRRLWTVIKICLISAYGWLWHGIGFSDG